MLKLVQLWETRKLFNPVMNLFKSESSWDFFSLSEIVKFYPLHTRFSIVTIMQYLCLLAEIFV